MSTIRGKLAEYLSKCGLDPAVADEIINAYRDGPLFPRDSRWTFEQPVSNQTVFRLMMLGVKAEAVKWIDANQPGHFARAFFVSV